MVQNKSELVIQIVRDACGRRADHFEAGLTDVGFLHVHILALTNSAGRDPGD
jgi:hypothetical protein